MSHELLQLKLAGLQFEASVLVVFHTKLPDNPQFLSACNVKASFEAPVSCSSLCRAYVGIGLALTDLCTSPLS